MEERWKEHCSDARNRPISHFHKAIALYGPDNWVHEVIVDKIDTIEEAHVLEKHYIKTLDTFENGYNNNYGSTGYTYSEDSEKSKTEKLKALAELRYENPYVVLWDFNNRTKVEGTRWDIEDTYSFPRGALKNLLNGSHLQYKGICLFSSYESGYTLPTSTVYSFEHADYGVVNSTIKDMVLVYEGLRFSNVHAVTTGIRGSYKGWTLKGNQEVLLKPRKCTVNRRVFILNVCTGEVKEVESIAEAVRVTCISIKKVRRSLEKSVTIGNYKFVYKENKNE